MSLLGIDVGTTGCKAIIFSDDGATLAQRYVEYDVQTPQIGYAELDASRIWTDIKSLLVATVGSLSGGMTDPIRALSVSSLGEAVVPVTAGGEILDSSILFFDQRGAAEAEALSAAFDAESFYRLNGNTIGPHYTLPKLMWIKEHQPELYEKTWKFLHWGSFVMYMLGAEAAADYSLANRTLCFDIDAAEWSDRVLDVAGIDGEKLPRVVGSGSVVGSVSKQAAAETGIPEGAVIVAGGHDQCVNATGCGVLESGQGMYGMGTFLCAVPVYAQRPTDAKTMLEYGLNTEHHARRDRFVSFIYNQGGGLVKWYRDTFAAADHIAAEGNGRDVYEQLFEELPVEPSEITVLPYFSGTGPPRFYTDPIGTVTGMKLGTTRGEILKGVLQGVTFYLRACIDALPRVGIEVDEYRAVGGGSKSDAWLQLSADILDTPITRAKVTEAGALGAAILAGAGCGIFTSLSDGVESMVSLDRSFEPNAGVVERYRELYDRYRRLEALHEEIDFR